MNQLINFYVVKLWHRMLGEGTGHPASEELPGASLPAFPFLSNMSSTLNQFLKASVKLWQALPFIFSVNYHLV